uniref:Uncharacterized protein n=1 Tax=Arcella intermedia TaxID=1963864 RepID=A0A6B2LGD5_9EUKA
MINKGFQNYGGIWRMCMWHKNQHILQLGDKPDEVGWDYYTDCLQNGAIIVNGHEHSYSRSKEITAFNATAPTFNEASPIRVGKNSTFVVVSGVAGREVRICTQGKEYNPWWGKTLCSPGFTSAGALVCVFNLNGNEREAYCYFKSIYREILDSFYLVSQNEIDSYLNNTQPQPPSSPSNPPPPSPSSSVPITPPLLLLLSLFSLIPLQI